MAIIIITLKKVVVAKQSLFLCRVVLQIKRIGCILRSLKTTI